MSQDYIVWPFSRLWPSISPNKALRLKFVFVLTMHVKRETTSFVYARSFQCQDSRVRLWWSARMVIFITEVAPHSAFMCCVLQMVSKRNLLAIKFDRAQNRLLVGQQFTLVRR